MKEAKNLQLYDPWQIRLVKQINKELENLENADICTVCHGIGAVFHKIVENYPESFSKIDPRAFSSGICVDCSGFGIIFQTETTNSCIYPSGDVQIGIHDEVICPQCGLNLIWFLNEDDENGDLFYSAKCHGKRYYLRPSCYNLTQQREAT